MHKLPRRFVILLLIAAILAVPGTALDPSKTLTQYAHRIWGQEEGLFQPTIYSILQTRDGFLWLGTQDSLIRFDGAHFREFDGADEMGFHHALIRTLLEDRHGNLWVGSLGAGVGKISPSGIITRYTTKQGLPSDSVFCLASESHDRLWICTDKGLALLDNGRFKVFTSADGLPSNQIRSTCEATDGTRWVAGLDFGLSRWNGSRFESYSDTHILPRENVTALACARDGSIWAGTDSGVIQIGQGASHSFPPRGPGTRIISVRDGLPDNAISALSEGPDGSLWIGTNDGISRYRNGEISVYRTRDGLSHSLVLSLYVDREQTLWAGTKDGLDQFTDAKVTPYTTGDGMLSNDAGPVLEDSAGHLWIGTLGEGLNWFDGRGFRAVTTRDGLLSNTILTLEIDHNGDLWVGTNKGVNRLHNGRVAASYTTRDGLSGPEVHALSVDAEGTLWSGTNKGLDQLLGSRFVSADWIPKSNANGIIALAGGRTVRLFVSTDGPGFYYLRDNAVTNYPLDVIRPVDCYYLDHVRHTAWMGTLGSGLLRWENGKITHIRVKDGLYDNRIYSILRDDRSNFWLASSKGIFRVSERDLEDFAAGRIHTVTSMPFSTGQLRFECRAGVQPAAWRTHDGRLWFSTTNGLVVVDPNHLISNPIPPPVQITAMLVNGQRIEPHENLELKPFEKNVEIRYSGLSFVSPEKVTFRYILDGYDKTWTDAGPRREAFFTNLPPGNFEFKVMARNADGVWSTGPAALKFMVEPRWYQRWWFFPLLAVALGLAITAGYRMRVRQLRTRFNLVLAERSRIARELHDTLLQGLSGITMQLQALWTKLPPSKEKQTLQEIIKDAGTCSTEARRSLWDLRANGTGAIEFSGKLEKLARELVAGKPISLVLDLQPISLRAFPEGEYQLLRIAQESISNTLLHACARRLEIRLRILNQQLQLTIEDDGLGFEDDLDHPYMGHFGLLGMRERAREIGAQLTVASSPGFGSKVSISLPLTPAGVSEPMQNAILERQTR